MEMGKPAYSESHKEFVKSLPCSVRVCRCRFTIPAHTPGFGGARGMKQKRSDFETIPLCDAHHDEQHQIGWKDFIRKYDLNIRGLLTELNVKPRISCWNNPEPTYWMDYQRGTYRLNRVDQGGLKVARRLAQEHRRDWLIENVFRPLEKAS